MPYRVGAEVVIVVVLVSGGMHALAPKDVPDIDDSTATARSAWVPEWPLAITNRFPPIVDTPLPIITQP